MMVEKEVIEDDGACRAATMMMLLLLLLYLRGRCVVSGSDDSCAGRRR